MPNGDFLYLSDSFSLAFGTHEERVDYIARPGTQAVHFSLIAPLTFPGGHDEQALAPESLRISEPAGHKQSSLALVPTPSVTAPLGQGWQTLDLRYDFRNDL